MIIEKNLKKDVNLELPEKLLEKAGIGGRIIIIVGENEIIIRRIPEETGIIAVRGRYLLVVKDPGNETDQASYKHKGVLPRACRWNFEYQTGYPF